MTLLCFDQLKLPVSLGKRSNVGDEGCDQEHITRQQLLVPTVLLNALSPTHVLRGQAAHQAIGQ